MDAFSVSVSELVLDKSSDSIYYIEAKLYQWYNPNLLSIHQKLENLSK
jgi:hypothetical protein